MKPTRSAPVFAAACWSLSALFAARVLGQAVQHGMPQPFLPPFEAFQGSPTPYWLLLAAQLVILGLMLRVAWRIQTGRLPRRRAAGRWLAWAGAVYMTVAVARIAIGLTVPGATTWFRTWIPAVFHLVLAGFVVTVSLYHLRDGAPAGGRAA